MDIAIWLSMASAIAATISAFYSHWVWGEARRTNLLALHTNRIEVFRAFNELRQAVQEQGLRVELKRVTPFLHPSRESKFYFSEQKTSQLLMAYFDTCFTLAEIAMSLDRSDLTEAEINARHAEQDRLSEEEQRLFRAAEKQLEKELYRSVR